MNEERLLNALGGVDDKYIEEAAPNARRKKRAWPGLCAAAACLCLAAAGIFAYRAEHPYPLVEVIRSPVSLGEIAEIPRWEDMELYEQYYSLEFGGTQYFARGGEVPAERIGAELGDITAVGWDEYASAAGQDAERCIAAVLYEIEGISPECAAAVRYEGAETCYAAVNSYYRPGNLGQFIDDLDLRENAVFGSVWYEYRKLSGSYATVRFDNVDSVRIWDLLLSAPAAENEYDEPARDDPKKILGISVSVPLLGYENISISVMENGYIMTNILDTGKMFFVGEENTQAFVDYVLDECEGYEVVYVDGGEAVPE